MKRTPRLPWQVVMGLIAAVALTVAGAGLALAFTDVSGNPYETAINALAGRHIITGFDDGTFRPDNPVTRQQFAKMIVLTMGYDVPQSIACPFTDVDSTPNPNDPLYPAKYVAVCAANHVTTGKTPRTFAPYDNTTREQLITMVSRAANLPDPPASYVPSFSENQFGTADHFANAKKADSAGLLSGLVDVGPAFNFGAPASRGECAQLLFNLAEYRSPLPNFADLKATEPVGYHFTFNTSEFWREYWEPNHYETNQAHPYPARSADGHLTLQILEADGQTVTLRVVIHGIESSGRSSDVWEAIVSSLPLAVEVKVNEQGELLAASFGAKGEAMEPLGAETVGALSMLLAPITQALVIPYSGVLVEPGDTVDRSGPYPSAAMRWADVQALVSFDSLTGDLAQLSYDFATNNMDLPVKADLLPLLEMFGLRPAPGHTEAVLDMNVKGQGPIVSSGQIGLDTISGLPTAVTSTSTVDLDMWLNAPLAPELLMLFPDSELMTRVFVHDLTTTLTLSQEGIT